MAKKIIWILCFACWTGIILAQSKFDFIFDGYLTYLKINETNRTYITQSQDGLTSISVPKESCATIDPTTQLIAISDNQGGDLRIVNAQNGTVIETYAWLKNWEPCTFTWQANAMLNLYPNSESSNQFIQQLDIHSATMTDMLVESTSSQPNLPFHNEGSAVIWSQDNRYVIYEQCLGGEFSSDSLYCINQSQVVLYDNQQGKVVEVFLDIHPSQLGVSSIEIEYNTQRQIVTLPRNPSVFISPSSQYLFYASSKHLNQFKLYDIGKRQLQEIWFDNAQLVFNSLTSVVQWSPDESKLGFWVLDSDDMIPSSPQNFVTLNMNLPTPSIVPSSYTLRYARAWLWSPDNQVVAFIDQDEVLMILDVATNAITTIDEGVYGLVAWNP